MSYMRHMHANLMCAAGFQTAFDQCRAFQLLYHTKMGDGMPAFAFGKHGHFLPVGRGPSNLCAYGASGWGRVADHDRQITAINVMCGKQLRQPFMRSIGFCDDQQTGCVTINAVDNAGALHASDTAQFAAAMVKQGVDQRAIDVPGCRMDNKTGRLVDDDQMIIFKHNLEFDVLRLCLVRLWRRDG